MVVRLPVGPAATSRTRARSTRWLPSARRRRRSAAALRRRRRCPLRDGGRERAADIRDTDPARPTGASVAVASTLQLRWQLTTSASARLASTPPARGRLKLTTGATSSGGGQLPAARQPVAAGETGSKRSTRLLLVSATYTSPLQSTAIAVGWERSPSSMPRAPHAFKNVPFGSNTSTRLFSLSTT